MWFLSGSSTKYVENVGAKQIVTLVLVPVVSGTWDTSSSCGCKEIWRRNYRWHPLERLSFCFSIRSSTATWTSLLPVATRMSALLIPQGKYKIKFLVGFYSLNLGVGWGVGWGEVQSALSTPENFCRTEVSLVKITFFSHTFHCTFWPVCPLLNHSMDWTKQLRRSPIKTHDTWTL